MLDGTDLDLTNFDLSKLASIERIDLKDANADTLSLDFDAVRDGFERVIRPRLADARFFWDQDKKTPLEAFLPQLDNVVFQESSSSCNIGGGTL